MALDTYAEGASSEQLESSLRYLVPKTSSAIVSSRAATIFSAGGDSYSPANGVHAITFRIQGSGGAAGGEFLDPSSLFFKALYMNNSASILNFKGPAWCAVSRITVRMSSAVVEDLTSFDRLYSMMHVLSPEDEKANAIVSAGDDNSNIGANASTVYGFSMTPLGLARCGVLIPLSLAPVEIVMELVPSAALFADQDWTLKDCQMPCTIKTVDQEISSKIHSHTVGSGKSLPIVLPGTYFCTAQVSSADATIHLSKSVSRATALFVNYLDDSADEAIDFLRPSVTSTGTWELLLNSRRCPDRALAWNDTPSFWNTLKQCMGKEPLGIDRASYVTQGGNKKHFIIAIDLTKSPSDGVAGGEVSFTGEHMRTSLATIQQKGCNLAGENPRISMCLRYDAIVEVSAGGCDLLT